MYTYVYNQIVLNVIKKNFMHKSKKKMYKITLYSITNNTSLKCI